MQSEGVAEFGTSADTISAADTAIEQAVDDARRAIRTTVHGFGARCAAARLAEAFGFTVTDGPTDAEMNEVAEALGIELAPPNAVADGRGGWVASAEHGPVGS